MTTTEDGPDAAPGDGTCEATLGDGDCTLRAAVQETNALPGSDTIELPAGSFALSIDGRHEDSAATGDIDILDGVVIRGAGMDVTVLDAAGLDRYFDVPTSGNEPQVELSGLTIRGGSGGAVRFLGPGSLAVRECALEDNHSSGVGGALYASRVAVSIERSRVSGNSADMQGGGIRVHRGSLEVTTSEVSDNTSGGRGGGIDASLADVRITRTRVEANLTGVDREGAFGGGVYLSQSNVVFEEVTLLANEATSGDALYLDRSQLIFDGIDLDGELGQRVATTEEAMTLLGGGFVSPQLASFDVCSTGRLHR